MISGLNQEVSVLGRTFHFQTELTRKGNHLFIRTEVFVGGKVVATRENRLDRAAGPGRLDEDGRRAIMKEQHGRVIERTLERVKAYQEKKGEQKPETPLASLPAFDAQSAGNFPPPSEETRQAASSAVRIRRIFGKLRLRLGLEQVPAAELPKRLETAARGFAWIIKSPTFEEIRLDEQMRCNLVSDQVNAWLASGRDPARAAEIWAEIMTFNDYVAAINHRAELIAFDRELLTWSAYRVQSGGMSTEILDQLQWLAGRDPELDQLLDKPDDVAREIWFPVLCNILAQVPRPKPALG